MVEDVSVALDSLVTEVLQSQHWLDAHSGETVRDAVSMVELSDLVVEGGSEGSSVAVDEVVKGNSDDVVLGDEDSC